MIDLQNLKRKIIGKQDKWTLEDIRIGIEHYKSIFGNYPSTLDFDKVDYLPSSRLIQRNFGGIIKLRELLGLNTAADYTKGEYRSVIASKTYKNSIKYEEEFYNYLISKIPEISVHEHKILRPGNICCDFFIYTDQKNGIVIDIFYAQDIFSLARIIIIKTKRYIGLKYPIYFVLVGNRAIPQHQIDMLVKNKKILLPYNINIITEDEFKVYINQGVMKPA